MLVEVSLLFIENGGVRSNIQTDAGRLFHSLCVKDQTVPRHPSLVCVGPSQGTSRSWVLDGEERRAVSNIAPESQLGQEGVRERPR